MKCPKTQSNSTTPTIVGGYRQWQQAGQQVKKGEHGDYDGEINVLFQ